MTGLVTAKLFELDEAFKNPKPNGQRAAVQFNPETLKVSYANQIVTPPGSGSQSEGSASRQFVGAGTTKLSLQLWFDVTAPMPGNEPSVDDVRRLTQKVTELMNPDPAGGKDKDTYVPPAVRFEWGSFIFDGIIDSLEESLEFFSGTGKPLRASMTLNMSQQKILQVKFQGSGQVPGRPSAPGTKPLAQAPAGSTVQGMAAAAGKGGDWQRIAAANGIENPRMLQPGQLINLFPDLPGR